MDISKLHKDETLELKITGRLDGYWANHLASGLEEEIRHGSHHVLLDLSGVAGTFFVDTGSITLGSHDVTHWPEHRRLGWLLKRSTREELKGCVRQLNVGLEDRLDNPIGTLSGGQRQTLTLLMATWIRPELLLLDEHTAALDPKRADQVIALPDAVVERENLTTLMVTHSMHQAVNLGDRLIMMHYGRIIQDFRGAEKKRLRVDDLMARFEEVRRAEQLDGPAPEMLRRLYV